MVNKWKWGDWVQARAIFVGLKTKSALGRSLDVSERHLHRWLNSPTPPRLQARTLAALAHTLGVEIKIISHDWINYEPEQLEIKPSRAITSRETSESGMKLSSASHDTTTSTIRREIKGIVDALDGNELNQLYNTSLSLMKQHIQKRSIPPTQASSTHTKPHKIAAKKSENIHKHPSPRK